MRDRGERERVMNYSEDEQKAGKEEYKERKKKVVEE